MSLVIHPLARLEIDDAIDHYATISPRLAKRLRDELDVALEEIATHPLRWGLYEPLSSHRRWRRRLTAGFPFLIIYEVVSDGVRVVAFPHVARKPGFWKAR